MTMACPLVSGRSLGQTEGGDCTTHREDGLTHGAGHGAGGEAPPSVASISSSPKRETSRAERSSQSSESPMWSLVRRGLPPGNEDAASSGEARPRRQQGSSTTLPPISPSEAPAIALPTVSVDGLLLFVGDTNIFPALTFEVRGESTNQ